MSKLLVSVRNHYEAAIVARHNIGIIDVKEPDLGSLGAAPPQTLDKVAQRLSTSDRAQIPRSFAIGELHDWIPQIARCESDPIKKHYGTDLLCQYQFIKAGLSATLELADWEASWAKLFCDLPSSLGAVLVCYVDHRHCNSPPPEDIIHFASSQPNCPAVLFDTFSKSQNLFAHLTVEQLKNHIDLTRQHGLTSVVAGSITESCLEPILKIAPDFIGVRGAVCHDGRRGAIDEARVARLSKRVEDV